MPIRPGRFSPRPVESRRLGPQKSLAPPEETDQPGNCEDRGTQNPSVQRSLEERRLPPRPGLELRQERHHPRAVLRELPDFGRDRPKGPGHVPDRVQPLAGGIDSGIEGRNVGMQGRRATRLRGRGEGLAGDLGGEESTHPHQEVQQVSRPVQACGFRQACPVDLVRKPPRGEGQRLRPPPRSVLSDCENGREPVRGLQERPAPFSERLAQGPEIQDPPPFGQEGVYPRGELRPFGLECGFRFRRNACKDLQRTRAEVGNVGDGRNRALGEVLRQRCSRPGGASLLTGERVPAVDLRPVLRANEGGGGEDGDAAQEGEPAKECEEPSSPFGGTLRGRLSARWRGRGGFGHAQKIRYRESDNEPSAGVSAP